MGKMRARLSFVTISIFCAAMVSFVGRADATCFAALSDPTSRNSSDWNDLANWIPTNKPAHGVIRFLPIPGGKGQTINIDYYNVTFMKPKDKTMGAVFKDLRMNFDSFAKGTTGYFDFGPYANSGNLHDKDKAANKLLWESDSPNGALMSFNLDTLFPKPYQHGLAYVFLGEAQGDVQVTCASTSDFIFSTVESVMGWTHPVAGNRGFGLEDNNDNSLTFYSKATDRESDSWGNYIVDSGTSKDVFCRGLKLPRFRGHPIS
jgi:hypothetical protein